MADIDTSTQTLDLPKKGMQILDRIVIHPACDRAHAEPLLRGVAALMQDPTSFLVLMPVVMKDGTPSTLLAVAVEGKVPAEVLAQAPDNALAFGALPVALLATPGLEFDMPAEHGAFVGRKPGQPEPTKPVSTGLYL
jgi:hypothetical protein